MIEDHGDDRAPVNQCWAMHVRTAMNMKRLQISDSTCSRTKVQGLLLAVARLIHLVWVFGAVVGLTHRWVLRRLSFSEAKL